MAIELRASAAHPGNDGFYTQFRTVLGIQIVENVALNQDAADRLQAIYWAAYVADLWGGTYADKNASEYFAE